MFCSVATFLSVFFLFHSKNLVLLNLISRHLTSISESFLKNTDIVDLRKVRSGSYSYSAMQTATEGGGVILGGFLVTPFVAFFLVNQEMLRCCIYLVIFVNTAFAVPKF